MEGSSLQQLYKNKPTNINEVRGESSKTIFAFMTGSLVDRSNHLWDIDDYERNRALLICYPEWRSRLQEMSTVSKYWKVLVDNWETIEEKYNSDRGRLINLLGV